MLPRPAPGPLASLPVLYLLLMFPGDTAPISFEKPCLQTLLRPQPPPSAPKGLPRLQLAEAYHQSSSRAHSYRRATGRGPDTSSGVLVQTIFAVNPFHLQLAKMKLKTGEQGWGPSYFH